MTGFEHGDKVEWSTGVGVRRGVVHKVWPNGSVTVRYVLDPARAPDKTDEFTLTGPGARANLTIYEKGTNRERKG